MLRMREPERRERRSPDRCDDAKRRRFEWLEGGGEACGGEAKGEALRASSQRQECRRSGFALLQ
ncbi:MAG: hypothetical protein LBK99_09770 [Opitutaceae bacterium]|jgi:hypothetical protein|nr:hypothetical protein [Opitutaceae bacterium]